jgi:hypothetical protein
MLQQVQYVVYHQFSKFALVYRISFSSKITSIGVRVGLSKNYY